MTLWNLKEGRSSELETINDTRAVTPPKVTPADGSCPVLSETICEETSENTKTVNNDAVHDTDRPVMRIRVVQL